MTQPSAYKNSILPPETPDPNVLQRRASDPHSSVWVSASAGSGKTKVLTDRVLRLLLPPSEHQKGSAPHKILCITFTKAAASEMQDRLSRILSGWAVMADGALQESLKDILGRAPQTFEIAAARRLFADVMDAPGGLNIMTIHAFCQSVLGRFPLEAGIAPQFKAIEEREAQALLKQAQHEILEIAQREKTGPLNAAINTIAREVNEDQFSALIENLGKERYQLKRLLDQSKFGPDAMYANLCDAIGIVAHKNAAAICLESCFDNAFDIDAMRRVCAYLSEGRGAIEKKSFSIIQKWLNAPPPDRAAMFDDYAACFITTENTPRTQGFPTKLLADTYPDSTEILRAESERLIVVRDAMNAAESALLTRDLIVLGDAMLRQYADIKSARGMLDFDDMITATLTMLKRENMAGWVMYKLDRGIDHVLLDEAQDTNPEQWDIINILTREFFHGRGARDINRTSFTVGDEKQSIYGFNRASPETYAVTRTAMQQMVQNAGKKWQPVDLNISFRSVPAVLRTVDATFQSPTLRAGMGDSDVAHYPWFERARQGGIVEIWPLFEGETEGETEDDPLTLPLEITDHKTPLSRMADGIAAKIKHWIDSGEILPSRARGIRPEDILILVRRRGAIMGALTQALRNAGIPVSGIDRMVLNDQIPVQDMLGFAEFALCPFDNLTLAAILKSPIMGWSEDLLFKIAAYRGDDDLWTAVQKNAPQQEIDYLRGLITLAGKTGPFAFFSHILNMPCPADLVSGMRAFRARLGMDGLDALDELINAALAFESSECPSLQGFLKWQSAQIGGIKRELEGPRGEVRIMTIHGAKGLQAPIVILPDTIRSKQSGNASVADKRILWPDKTGLPAPIWTPRSDMECRIFVAAKKKLITRQDEELNRLLYVAMTRAEDRLYLCGATSDKNSGKDIAPDSWYNAVKTGIKSIPDFEMLDDGTLKIWNPQTGPPDKAEKNAAFFAAAKLLPVWVSQPAPPIGTLPRPLTPSRSDDPDIPVFSPLKNHDSNRFLRGNLTHKLLQYLPGIESAKQSDTAAAFAALYGSDLSPSIRESVVHETLAILNHPEFKDIFGPGSMAEIPITGLVNGRALSGQIDRLLVTDKEIWIIDYKTNRPPPIDTSNVPEIYKRQMLAYGAALRSIYPGRAMRAFLLWTDGPVLMPIALDL
jgi:ATP-dependent helicase/nuclease subunit A